jgi:D-alanine-D-alanine ligase
VLPLTPIEIDFVKGHEFDFSARYTAEFVGLRPLDVDPAVADALGRAAVRAHEVLGLRDVSRSDFIVEEDGSFVVLETAITPGTTETSVFPFACTASGTTLGEVASDLLVRALGRRA